MTNASFSDPGNPPAAQRSHLPVLVAAKSVVDDLRGLNASRLEDPDSVNARLEVPTSAGRILPASRLQGFPSTSMR